MRDYTRQSIDEAANLLKAYVAGTGPPLTFDSIVRSYHHLCAVLSLEEQPRKLERHGWGANSCIIQKFLATHEATLDFAALFADVEG